MSRWWTGPCQCSICGHREVAVVEIGDDETQPVVPLECGACHNMTMQEAEPEEEEKHA